MRITGTLHEDQYTFFIISHSVLLRIRNILDKHGRENQNTHFMFKNIFKKNCAIWDNMEINIELDRPQLTIWCMITNAANTCSE